jgi:hypothetical protein
LNAKEDFERRPHLIRTAAIGPLFVPFDSLPDNGCRFEVGNATEARDFRFCGLPAARRRPFCPAHAAIV